VLNSCRALDLTDENGFLCGKILADLGVDVIKVEKPGGDPSRRTGPCWADIPHPEKSLYWFAYNSNKRGITLNIEANKGKEILKELVNPGVIDFIRRCKTKDEAIEILDFCLKRGEIGRDDYEKYKSIIMQKGGLDKIIKESGGRKDPGYFERKYYKKDFNDQKFKNNNT